MQNNKSNQTHAKARGRRRRIFTGGVAVVGSAGLAAAVLLPSGTALAAYQATSPTGTAVATLTVGGTIALNITKASFTMNGLVGESPTVTGAVTMNVLTNNSSGYNVTVQPATADFTNAAGAVTLLPASDLSVVDPDTANTAPILTAQALPIAPATPITVYNQPTASIALGDDLTNTYSFTGAGGIPAVPFGSYSLTLDYVATTNV